MINVQLYQELIILVVLQDNQNVHIILINNNVN